MENSHNEPKYIEVRGARVHNLKNVNVNVPLHQIVGIAGVSGSGKTTMVLESLIPGLEASLNHTHLPEHVKSVVADGISHVKLIDASPIGINVRSTVATYANVHDELRKVYAKTTEAKNLKHKAGVCPHTGRGRTTSFWRTNLQLLCGSIVLANSVYLSQPSKTNHRVNLQIFLKKECSAPSSVPCMKTLP